MSEIFDLLTKQRDALAEAISWPGLKRRQFKYEYAAIEVALIESFRESLSAASSPSLVEVDGFVSRIGGSRIILRPSLAVNYGVVCEIQDHRRLPTDFQFGRVRGYRTLAKPTLREASRWVLKDAEFSLTDLPKEHLKPELSAFEVGDIVLQGYVDPPKQLKRDLVSSLTSSPSEFSRRGGLTATLLPIHERFADASHRLLQDLKQTIPKDLTSDNSVAVSIPGVGRFEISPFPWNVRSLWSTELSSEKAAEASTAGASWEPGLKETTTGISATAVAPKRLDEVWMRVTDFPLVIERSLVRHSRPIGFDLDLAKFLITVHSSRPYADPSVEDDLLNIVQPKLIRLRRDYDGLGYSGLVDLDVRGGSPRSIMAIAKSIARTKGLEKVNKELVENAVDEFINSRKEVFDIWSDLGLDFGDVQISTRKKLSRIGRTAQRIYAFVREHPNSTRTEIRGNLSRVQESIFNHAFEEMVKQGILYPTSTVDDRYSTI